MRTATKTLLILATACGIFATRAQAAERTMPLEEGSSMLAVSPHGHFKAVYNIQTDATEAGSSKGLYYARGLFEAFRRQGVGPRQVDVHLVLHGDAAMMLLKDESYQRYIGDPFAVNPNDKIVQELLSLGAHVEICHSAMKSHGWHPSEILPGVTIVHDGYTRLINLENKGYAYLGSF
jgi:intracellular sulfur oxidation DsrE/DsrF family protein